MLNNLDWIKPLILQERKKHALVTEAASSRIEVLLMTQLSVRQISAAELKTLAYVLLSDLSSELTEGTRNED